MPSIVIRPPGPKVDNFAEFREFWRYKHLLRVLVERGIRIRYKNSVLGVAWSMVTPILSVIVYSILITAILHTGSSNTSAYIFAATLPWNFFSFAVLDSSAAILQQLGLLKKIYFPREIPVISNVLQNFVQFLISMFVFVVYRWGLTTVVHGWPGWPPYQVIYLPIVITIMVLFTTGFAFFISALNVFYEDVKFVVSLLLTLGFYFVPVLYPAEKIQYSARLTPSMQTIAYHAYLLNPVAWVSQAFRQMLFGVYNMAPVGSPPQMTAPFDVRIMCIDGFESVLMCYIGYAFFNRMKRKFTERP